MKEKEEKIYTWSPKQIAGFDPVNWNASRPNLIRAFRQTLRDAKDEKPLQDFFEKNPVALLFGLVRPHTAWVIPRPRLPLPTKGGGIPDFIVCEWSSIGPKWIIVELESPTRNPVIEKGVSAICNHAAEQINDYRTYLNNQALFLRANGWPEIHGECAGVIIIGRRTDKGRAELRDKLVAFRRQNIEVCSYDRILELCEEQQRHVETNWATVKNLSQKQVLPRHSVLRQKKDKI